MAELTGEGGGGFSALRPVRVFDILAYNMLSQDNLDIAPM